MPVKILALIIHNFKSFRNEHTIQFSEATTFMGGSQSGKTNLIDAINFVTGEQDLQNLRVSTPKELVHREVNNENEPCFVEATLTLDDDNHKFRRTIVKNRSVYEIDGDEISKEEYLNQLNLVNIGAETRSFILYYNMLKDEEWRTPEAIVKKIENFGFNEVVKRYEQLDSELSSARETALDFKTTQSRLRSDIKRIESQINIAEVYTPLKTALDKNRLNLSVFNLYHTEIDIKKLHEKLAQLPNDRLPEQKQQRENIEENFLKSIEDRQSLKKDLIEHELVRVTDNHQHHCLLKAAEVKLAITKLREETTKRTITSLKGKLESVKVEEIEIQKIIGEIENEKLVASDIQLPKYSNELNEEHDRLEVETSGNLNLFLLEQHQKDDQKFRSEMEKSLEFWNNQKTKEDARKLQTDQVIEAQLTNLQSKTEKKTELLKNLLSSENRIKSISEEIKSIDLKLMKSKLARLEQEKSRVLELLKEFGGVYGRLKDFCRSSDPEYDITLKLALKQHSDTILVDSTSTVLKCIQYLKDNSFPAELFLPLNDLQDKSSSMKLHPNLQNQGIKCINDVLVCDSLEFDARKAVMFAAQKTLLCMDSQSATKAAYNIANKRQTSVDPMGFLNHRSGIITKSSIPIHIDITDLLNAEQISELEYKRFELNQQVLHSDDVEKIQADLLRIECEIKAAKIKISSLQRDFQRETQDTFGNNIQKIRLDLEIIDQVDPEMIQNLQDLKDKEFVDETNHFQSFCEKTGVRNIGEYRRLRFWQNNQELCDDGIKVYKDHLEYLEQRCANFTSELEVQSQELDRVQQITDLATDESKKRVNFEMSHGELLLQQAELEKLHDKLLTAKKQELLLKIQLQNPIEDEFNLMTNRERTQIQIQIDEKTRSRYDIILKCWKDQVPIRLTMGNQNDLFLPLGELEGEDENLLLHQQRLSLLRVCYDRLPQFQKEFSLEQRKQHESKLLQIIDTSEKRLRHRVKVNPEVYEQLLEKYDLLKQNLKATKQSLITTVERIQKIEKEFENVRQQRINEFREDIQVASEALRDIYQHITQQQMYITFISENVMEPYLHGVKVNLDLKANSAGLLALYFALHKTPPIMVMDCVESGLNENEAKSLVKVLTTNRIDTQSQIILTTKWENVNEGKIYGLSKDNENSILHLYHQ